MVCKKVKLILIIICLLLSGCTNNNNKTSITTQIPTHSHSGSETVKPFQTYTHISSANELTDNAMPSILSKDQKISVPKYGLIDCSLVQIELKDINGDKILDYIFVIGYETNDAPFTQNQIIIKDGATGKIYKIIDGDNDEAFQLAVIKLADVNGDGTDDIILGQDYGGCGGFGTYGFRVYSFINNEKNVLFTSEPSPDKDFLNYKVIVNKDKKIVVDYAPLNYHKIFDAGKYSNNYYPVDCCEDGFYKIMPVYFGAYDYYALECIQYAYGTYHADFVGVAQSTLKYNKLTGKWDVVAFKFMTEGMIEEFQMEDYYYNNWSY